MTDEEKRDYLSNTITGAFYIGILVVLIILFLVCTILSIVKAVVAFFSVNAFLVAFGWFVLGLIFGLALWLLVVILGCLIHIANS